MARTDGIEVRQGCAPWVFRVHWAAGLLAAAAILISPASLALKSVLLPGLLATHFAAGRHLRRAARNAPRIRVFDNGTASLLTRAGAIPALLQGGAWTSRWISVARLKPLDGRRTLHSIVCRSANAPEAYRRLQILLRHVDGVDPAPRRGWS